jgi:hypothetical protein
MFIRKAHAGNTPWHSWAEDGQVLWVEEELAEQLLAIPTGGFSIAEPPVPEPEPQSEPTQEEEPEAETNEPKRGGRPRLPRDGDGNIIRS